LFETTKIVDRLAIRQASPELRPEDEPRLACDIDINDVRDCLVISRGLSPDVQIIRQQGAGLDTKLDDRRARADGALVRT
jgi:hypothetical protein